MTSPAAEDTEASTSPRIIREWLGAIHGASPGLIHICHTSDWHGAAFPADQLDQAADYAADLDSRVRPQGVYLRMTTLRDRLAPGKRGGERDALALSTLWADVDLAGPGHATSQALPTDETAGRSIITEAGLPDPTLWVHSGGGLYPFWMLDKPHVIGDDLDDVKSLSGQWQQVLAAAAARLGLHYGSGVGDLARVLRIPGTTNRKEGLARPCRILGGSTRRYSYDELHDALADALAAIPEPEPAQSTGPRKATPRTEDDGLRPGDDFNVRADWGDDVLLPCGAAYLFSRGDVHYWQRPGKTGRGISATINARGTDRLHNFTDAWEGLEQHASFSKFEAFAFLYHSGDFKAASRALGQLGYGDPLNDGPYEFRPSSSDADEPAPDRQPPPGTKPPILITNSAKAARTITQLINTIGLPDVYVTDGSLTRLDRVSGNATATGSAPLPVVASTMTVDSLASTLAHHTYTYCVKVNAKTQEKTETETMPAPRVLSAVLSERYWPGVRPLYGVVGAPVLRADGTLMQDPGYDPTTGLYLAPKVSLPRIPERPEADRVAVARDFLLRDLLGDFPWVDDSDRANYVALLVTNILRPYAAGALTPFGLISASTQSSGKSILSGCVGMLYGHEEHPWLRSDEELRKTITADLAKEAAVIIFDNVREGAVIDSPVFAGLFTRPVWSDRILGTNRAFTSRNDRLWLATGNNIHLGGDMRTRTVLVRLDPNMPRPELRTDFAIPNLDAWIKLESSRAVLLEHLLVLVMDWIAHGAPRASHPMRQFSTWAEHVGGFTAHHGIGGFLGNAAAVAGLDDDDAEWTAFLERWHGLFGPEKKEAKHVRQSADVDFAAGRSYDRWEGDFITDRNGAMPSTKSLGRYLAGQVGRYHGDYVLRSESGARGDRRVYWVEEYQP